MEVNYASIIIEKTLAGTINDTAVTMVTEMCAQSLSKVIQIKSAFERFNCKASGEVLKYTECATFHFEVVMFWSMFKLNQMMEEGIAEKTKDVEQLCIENNILANHLLDVKHDINKMLKSLPKGENDFNTSGNLMHTLSFLEGKGEYELKK